MRPASRVDHTHQAMTVQFNFEWDPAKARANLKKHGVSFEAAVAIFRDPHALSVFDEGHNDDEERWVTLGIAEQGRVLLVIHTFREIPSDQEITVRVISARRATRKEQREYEADYEA
jgi:uncharacterized DUF497 family protein